MVIPSTLVKLSVSWREFFNLESAVERPVECVGFCDWRGAMRSNSLLLRRFALYKDVPVSRSTGRARATNAARRKRQRAIQVVATHPAGELSKTIKQDVDQNVNTSSKRSTAESRFNVSVCNRVLCVAPKMTWAE